MRGKCLDDRRKLTGQSEVADRQTSSLVPPEQVTSSLDKEDRGKPAGVGRKGMGLGSTLTRSDYSLRTRADRTLNRDTKGLLGEKENEGGGDDIIGLWGGTGSDKEPAQAVSDRNTACFPSDSGSWSSVVKQSSAGTGLIYC